MTFKEKRLFKYSEQYDQKILELNGIIFCCEEEQDEYEVEAQNLSKAYYNKLSDIIEFMLHDRLWDFYENYISDLKVDIVKENLGIPMIDLDMHQIIYCEQTLDDEHIFTVEYGEDFNDLLYCSVDG